MSEPTTASVPEPGDRALLLPAAPSRLGSGWGRWLPSALGALGLVAVVSLTLAWHADQRGASLEHELVRRQQDSAVTATEARAVAKQAQETAADSAAKVALVDARLAEVSTQRSQLEELIQSLSRTREENLLIDVEAAIRVALQQTAITGSAEPLVATLKQSDERIERYNQPRLEGVRRAIVRDLDRVRATSVADIASLGIKLDEAIRLVDELPLTSAADATSTGTTAAPLAGRGSAGEAAPRAAATAASTGWGGRFIEAWSAVGGRVWSEAKSLVRVSRIDHPEGMLLAPEQSFFVRENLKLRLLNARLALLSRQFDTAQADLQAAEATIDRYFERNARRTLLVEELIRQVAGQARQVVVPRPDDTLAALAAAGAGR